MSEDRAFRFTLDHVELFVPDRTQAVEWYAQVFGCQKIAGTEQWATHPQGPLMLPPDGGRTKRRVPVPLEWSITRGRGRCTSPIRSATTSRSRPMMLTWCVRPG